MDHRRSNAGFTLIEMLVVVLIMGLLATFVATRVFSQKDRADFTMAKAEVAGIEQAIEAFRLDNARYPTNAEGLDVLVPPPPTDLPRYDPNGYQKNIPDDPWGRPYVYSTDGKTFIVRSYGKDGLPGGEAYDADIDNAPHPRGRG